ncbi:hypothetical protein [Microbacterium sp. bgisy203]|uniref:hypothetical protein n=1 Tax=Microbacterium sp. bgisy203 TaxID=3413799 RepID=UPI003D753DEF
MTDPNPPWRALILECVSLLEPVVTDVTEQQLFHACLEVTSTSLYSAQKLKKSLTALPPNRIFDNVEAEPCVQRLAIAICKYGHSTMALLPRCPGCGDRGLVSGVRGSEARLCVACKRGRAPETCFACGDRRRVHARLGRIPYCEDCWTRAAFTKLSQRIPRPCRKCGATTRSGELCPACNKRPSGYCEMCNMEKKHIRLLPTRTVCESCVQMAIRYPKKCDRCNRPAVCLFGRFPEWLCASCVGFGKPFACAGCGHEDAGRQGKRCFKCKKPAAIDRILGPDLERFEPLRRLIDRPGIHARAVVEWCEASQAADILRRMTHGEIPATLEALDAMRASRATRQIRALLIESGLDEDDNPDLGQYRRWSQIHLQEIASTSDRLLLQTFSRWHLERRLEEYAPRTRGADNGRYRRARDELIRATEAVGTLRNAGKSLQQATQHDVDELLAGRPYPRRLLVGFLRWAHENTPVTYEKPSFPRRNAPHANMSASERSRHIARLLNDQAIPLATRVGGLFVIALGQTLARTVALRTTALARTDGNWKVTFGREQLTIPAGMSALLATQIRRAHETRVGTEPWLFVGYAPGQHLTSGALGSALNRVGINATQARNAALRDFAQEVPARVIADLLGLSPGSAERWAQVSGRTWSSYPAMRAAT